MKDDGKKKLSDFSKDELMNMDSEELLSLIMEKKKKNVKKKETNIKVKTNQFDGMSNDEIYDYIKNKKNQKKKKIEEKIDSKQESKKTIKKEDNSKDIDVNDLKKSLDVDKDLEIKRTKKKNVVDNEFSLKNKKGKVSKSKKRNKSSVFNVFKLLLIVLILFGVSLLIIYNINRVDLNFNIDYKAIDSEKIVEKINKKLYDECVNQSVNEKDNSDEISEYLSDLNKYLKKYSVSVGYLDLSKGFNYYYGEDKSYYAASSIKSLDALYIYSKAAKGELSLDEKVLYVSKFVKSFSPGVKKHKIGSAISLRELVSYAILYSDNSAHEMLISYIGLSNLRAYAKALGAVNVFPTSEHFGNISVNDAIIYMKELYNLFESDYEGAKELKQFFIDADVNDLYLEDNSFEVGHKYGHYSSSYHNLGIVYADNPYIIIVLTNEGENHTLVNNISKKIYDLHLKYYSNREQICFSKVYENKKN